MSLRTYFIPFPVRLGQFSFNNTYKFDIYWLFEFFFFSKNSNFNLFTLIDIIIFFFFRQIVFIIFFTFICSFILLYSKKKNVVVFWFLLSLSPNVYGIKVWMKFEDQMRLNNRSPDYGKFPFPTTSDYPFVFSLHLLYPRRLIHKLLIDYTWDVNRY